MKKVVSLIIACFMLVGLFAGCQAKPPTAEPAAPGKAEPEKPQPAEKPKEGLTFGNITFDNAGEWNQLSSGAFEWAANKVGVKVITIPVITNTEDQVNGMLTLISSKVDAISVYTATAELDVQLWTPRIW